MHEKTAHHNLVLGSISGSSGRHGQSMGISGIILHYLLMTLPKFRKIMKSNKGFSIILRPTVSYLTLKPLCLFSFQNYCLSLSHTHKHKKAAGKSTRVFFPLVFTNAHQERAYPNQKKINVHLNSVYLPHLYCGQVVE